MRPLRVAPSALAVGSVSPAAQPARARAARALKPLAFGLVATLVVYMAVPLDIFSVDKGPAFAPNPLSKAIKLALLVIGAITIYTRLALAKRVLGKLNRFFAAFVLLVPASYLWSISRSDTIGRYMSILTVVAVCLAFCVLSWDARHFQRALRPTVTLIVVGSIVFAMISPDLAISHGRGVVFDAWHGLLVQKNSFGQLASLGVILWLHAWLAREASAWKALLFGGASAVCVVLSRSSTSLIATALVIAFLFLLMRSPSGLKRYLPYIIGIFALTVVAYAIAILDIVPGLNILLKPIELITGKDATFSDRTVIWEIIKEHIALSPYLGTGYGAYWVGPDPRSPSFAFLGRMYFYPAESHNGYLEVVNDLGYFGLACLLGYLLVYIRQCLQLWRIDRVQSCLFLGLFFAQAIENLSESNWFQVNSAFIFVIMTLATFAQARMLLEYDTIRQTAPSAAPVQPRFVRASRNFSR